MTFINAKIYTMNKNSEIIESGYFEILGGKIKKIGKMSDFKGGNVIDLNGQLVFPGFIDGHTHLGMWEDSLGFEGSDGNEDTDPATPHLRAIDAININDKCFSEALSAGITTVLSGPGSSNPIGGQIAVLKTYGTVIDDMIINPFCGMKFSLGENPKTSYNSKSLSPVTRMATAAIIREQLHKAKKYYEQLNLAEKNDCDEPDYDGKCEALIPVITKKIPACFHAHRQDDIITAVRISKEFDLKYIIIHGTSGYKIKKFLKTENVDILSGPIICDRSKPELSDLNPSNTGVLSNAGIRCAIITDHPIVPVQYLTLSAALCVNEGMAYMEALRAITINPAKIHGIDKRTGSLETEKDADFCIFEKDPLQIGSKPKAVYINGEKVI